MRYLPFQLKAVDKVESQKCMKKLESCLVRIEIQKKIKSVTESVLQKDINSLFPSKP